MLCEYCNLKPATVILKQNIDGEMKTVHICRDCAQSLGVTLDKINVGEVMNDMDSFFASMFGKKSSSPSKPGTIACDFCGMTLTETLPEWLRLLANTLLIAAFAALVVRRDFPLSRLPYVGRYFRK